MDITDIDLFDQHVGMECAKIRFWRSSKSLVLLYLIKMWVMYMEVAICFKPFGFLLGIFQLVSGTNGRRKVKFM